MPITINGTDNSATTPALVGSDTDTGVFFPAANTMAFATGGTEQVRVTSAGKVSIGTTEANRALNVYETNTTANSSTSFWNLTYAGPYIRNESNTANTLTGIGFGGGSSGTSVSGIANILESTTLGALGFYTGGSGAGNVVPERMRIDSSGNVLVGTTTRGFGLFSTPTVTVNPSTVDGFTVGPLSQDKSAYTVQANNNTGTRYAIYIANGSSTPVGTVSFTSAGTAYNTTSDYRLKENIAPMTGALGVVSQLKPVTYNWKIDGSSGQGFIAHELQAVVPDCVTGEKDAVNEDGSIKPQGIDTSFLVATLTAAIQELKAIVDQQSTELDSVKAELATLKGAA